MMDELFTWDWRAQPPMDAIAKAVSEMSASGSRIHMREVNTESDQYAWIIADHEVSDEEAARLYFDEGV